MADQPTCGRGLAEHAALPAKLAELTAAVADNLEAHMGALDLDDQDAKREHDVYQRLAGAHRDAAVRLRATGEDMAGSRDLPMGRHDQAAMSSARVVDAFERLVRTERELLSLLRGRLDQHEAMLAGIGRAAGQRPG
jgi:hypothetical protein